MNKTTILDRILWNLQTFGVSSEKTIADMQKDSIALVKAGIRIAYNLQTLRHLHELSVTK